VPAFLQRGLLWPGLIASLAALAVVFPLHAADKNPVIVHEWGTFTSLQDEKGDAIGGINVDDEPVPDFVRQDGGPMIVAAHSSEARNFGLPPYSISKGWLGSDTAVTMRLETPVLYIYPPKGEAPKSVPLLDVHVDFHGGVLSQFYPEAKFDGLPEIPGTTIHSGPLKPDTTTSLTWSGVRLGSTRKPVETDDRVWTTPREVSAPLLEVKTPGLDQNGQPGSPVTAEHFLFYRGVGQLDSPVELQNPGMKGKMEITARRMPLGFEKFNAGWMVEIRPDGSCAFRCLPGASASAGAMGFSVFDPSISSVFAESEFSAANLSALKASMQAQLVKEGLYDDEASAMLRTWELSYFKSPGLRFFYIVPRSWVDRVLPLRVAGAPVEITRVMVGRIELISTAQKAALSRLAAGPCPDLDAVKETARQALESPKFSFDEADAYYRGDKPLRDLGIFIPPLVQDYLDLGRFRDALLLHEQKLHPSVALADFIRRNSIGPAVSDADATKPGSVAVSNQPDLR
jgi:hypothetical protein